MQNEDNELTLDVSHCERLIMLITILYSQYEQGKLKKHELHIDWENIEKLKEKCRVLPSDYVEKLEVLEAFRNSA